MDASITNNFIFILFIIVKTYRKVKRPEAEVAENIRRFIYSEIALFHFFELTGIALSYVADSLSAYLRWDLSCKYSQPVETVGYFPGGAPSWMPDSENMSQ